MTTMALVSAVSLIGWLVLALGGLRTQQLPRARLIRMALLWIGIFLAVAVVFGWVMR